MTIRRVCIQDCDDIGRWSGAPLRAALEPVGADLRAPFIGVPRAGGTSSSIDNASALHPRTLLATTDPDGTLPDPFGFPLRLRTAVELGFENPKCITAIEAADAHPGGNWEDPGFTWFGGL